MPFVPVPNAGESLDGTRDYIRENMNLLRNTIGRNHVDVNDVNYGKHNFSEYIDQGVSTPAIVAGECATYGRSFGGVTQLTFTQDATGNVYQLTRAIPASVATFAQATGWTFLPGGLLLQYGTGAATGGTTPVVFPVTFTTLYSITLSRRSTSSTYGYSSPSTTGFDFVSDSPAVGVNFGWMAIGV